MLAQQGPSREVIVVDNASSDGSVDWVRAAHPEVRVVSLDANRGFTGGNNAGAAIATGDTLVFLNNDTVVEPGWLQALVGGLDLSSGFALASSRIVYMHAPDTIDSAGDGFIRWGGAYKRFHGAPASEALDTTEVFGVCGGACAVRRRVFEELGGFDDTFFFSHEDVDLSYRARLRGYRCRYVASAVVHHHGGGTSGKASPFAVFHGQRNLEWVYLKDTPTDLLWRTLPGHVLYLLAAAVHFARVGRFGAFLRAKGAALAGVPRVWRARAQVQATRTVPSADLWARMDARWLATKRREKRYDASVAERSR